MNLDSVTKVSLCSFLSFPNPICQRQTMFWLFPLQMSFAHSKISYKWNHTVCILFVRLLSLHIMLLRFFMLLHVHSFWVVFQYKTIGKLVYPFSQNHSLSYWYFLILVGEGNGTPLQCSCLENPRDGGAWWAAVYGVAQSRTRLKWLSSSSILVIMNKAAMNIHIQIFV